MMLETDEDVIADPATEADVVAAIAGLIRTGRAYVILGDWGETYLQAVGTIAEDFIVERRDGCAGEHYRGDWRVSAADLTTMFVGYLQGKPDWSHVLTWHKIDVGQDPPAA